VKIEHEVLSRCLHSPNSDPLDAGSKEPHEAFLLRCADQGRQFKEGDVHWREILKSQYTHGDFRWQHTRALSFEKWCLARRACRGKYRCEGDQCPDLGLGAACP
jgi:hypothetical protein